MAKAFNSFMQRTQPKQNATDNELELNGRISALWGLISNVSMRVGQQKQVHLRVLPARVFDANKLASSSLWSQCSSERRKTFLQWWKPPWSLQRSLGYVLFLGWNFATSTASLQFLVSLGLFLWGSDLETKQNNVFSVARESWCGLVMKPTPGRLLKTLA